MSDQHFKEEIQPKPPQGSEKKASAYITQLTGLINQDKLIVIHTDLSKHDPSNLQDHYRVNLKDYMIEVSHAKDANSGRDSFILLFTNLKNIRDGCNEKLILGYAHLTTDQFSQFKNAATIQDIRLKRQEEERLFKLNLQPIDDALEEIATGQSSNGSIIQKTASEENLATKESTSQTKAPTADVIPETLPQPTLSSIAQSNPKPQVSTESLNSTPVTNSTPSATIPSAYS